MVRSTALAEDLNLVASTHSSQPPVAAVPEDPVPLLASDGSHTHLSLCNHLRHSTKADYIFPWLLAHFDHEALSFSYLSKPML